MCNVEAAIDAVELASESSVFGSSHYLIAWLVKAFRPPPPLPPRSVAFEA